jgi:hypothetical protein
MSETQEASKPSKATTEYEAVTMTDGRVVQFPGKRNVDKTVTIDEAAGTFSVRLDFRNGQTRQLDSAQLTSATFLRAAGHGVSQKLGDNFAGVKELDDMVLATDEMIIQLTGEGWNVARESGDSMAGASIVIRAVCEATGKDIAFVKAFLQGKLDKAKAAGQKLSRQELYNSFRNPTTKTGAIIKRLEEEKVSKTSAVAADDLLAEIGA